jgi:hypothetical protein
LVFETLRHCIRSFKESLLGTGLDAAYVEASKKMFLRFYLLLRKQRVHHLSGYGGSGTGANAAAFYSFRAGLPDGTFSNPKIQIWVNSGGP